MKFKKKPKEENQINTTNNKTKKIIVFRKKSSGLRKFVKIVLIILGILALLVLSLYVYIIKTYKLNKIQVTGSSHYTDEEIIKIVSNNKKTDNTVFFYLENKIHPVENITFIDKFDVEVIGKNTITIAVYEKSMAGCVDYMDQYIYFDDDGTVLETSSEKLEDIPCIDGLDFDTIVVGEKLPVEDEKMFQNILTMTQMIEKDGLIIDEIRFDNENQVVLYKGDIKILMGSNEGLEEKFMNLNNILTQIDGKSGILDMSGYEANSGNVIFKENS